MLVVSAVYIYISVKTADMYFHETRQKLDIKIANHIIAHNTFFTGGSINISALKNVFHNVMVINPKHSNDLLDTAGTILAFDAPNNSVKINKVPLEPIEEFISSREETFLLSIDPKNPNKQKPFSAAKVVDKGKFKGYIYVILGGQEYENASQLLFGSYILKLDVRSMIIALYCSDYNWIFCDWF